MPMKKLSTTLILGLLLITIFNASTITAQSVSDNATSRFGLLGDFGLFQHGSDFRGLPGLPTCCPRYDKGTGSGFFAGLVYDIPISSTLFLNLRGVYSAHKGVFTSIETRPVLDITNTVVDGVFEHRLETSLGIIALEPIVRYPIFGNLALNGGMNISYALQKDYTQQETLLSPSTGTFGNGQRVELQNSGAIPQSASIGLAVLAGISYSIPLSKTWTLAPEFLYSIGLTNEVQDLKWSISAARFGAILYFQPQPSAKEPIIEPIPEKPVETPIIVEKKIIPKETPPEPPKPTMNVMIQAVGMDGADVDLPLVRLRVEEFISTQMYPLLNYVFFDDNSSELPARYNSLQKTKVQEFTEKSLKNLQNKNSLEVYYDILNIVGYRMSRLPKSKLTLTGCNSNQNAEQSNLKLSQARAEAVKNYLISTWNIEPNRISAKARNLPEVASNLETGIEENRRVELTSTVSEILDPVIIQDTLRTANPPSVKFSPSAIVESGVKQWNIIALQQSKTLRTFKGEGEMPQSLVWRVNDEQSTMPRQSIPIDYTLDATDNTEKLSAHAEGSIPVELITIERKQSEKRDDKYIDRYNLILFDFDRATLTQNHKRIIDFIGKRTNSKSTVSIIGYTDLKGTFERNQSLQLQRANAVAKALNSGQITVKGAGETNQLFDNTLPEGRFYNRTVVIEVETPIEK
jgi:outer membrane protein OmpA-like peptidoglycan-associated protein